MCHMEFTAKSEDQMFCDKLCGEAFLQKNVDPIKYLHLQKTGYPHVVLPKKK